eukprot:maker-scaffold_4-snap-gene-8.64-mRNA-1 protein AED:0.01 eAED:0.01 QI:0/0/0/1/1/1/2/0/190
MNRDFPEKFFVTIKGCIEMGKLASNGFYYCRYDIIKGPDWEILEGNDYGLTQISYQSSKFGAIWNQPLQITFSSTSVHGWPQIVLSVYGFDILSRDVLEGYTCFHLLPRNCQKENTFTEIFCSHLFKPMASSFAQSFLSHLKGMRPELSNPRDLAQAKGREKLIVKGLKSTVKVTANIGFKNFFELGYEL